MVLWQVTDSVSAPATPTRGLVKGPLPTLTPAPPTAPPVEPAPTHEPTPPLPSATISAQPTLEPPSPTEEAIERDTLAAVEAALIPQRDLYEIALRLGQIAPDTPRVVSESDPGYQMGDRLTFNVSNMTTQENFEVEAALRAQSAHASWWVATDVTVNQRDLESSARVFEESTYPTNRALFGNEWSPGVDGDPRVHIFLGEVPGVGGYFSSADEFPRSVNPFSNEKEIFYINVNNAQPGQPYFDGILAHEFQHMIHWYSDRNEELWVNEGMSELAAKLNGFDVGNGPAGFAREPDLPLTDWLKQSLPFYGSAFLFLDYFHQRFGNEAVAALVREAHDGEAGFDVVLAPEGSSFDQLFAEWTVANLLDDPGVADGRYDYSDDAPRAPAFARTVQRYPLVEREEVYQYGTDYLRFEPSGAAGTLEVALTGDAEVALLPTEAHSGKWMLWSNRGDDGDSATTRAFDLRGVTSATLRYWAWYDLENEYDYAYLMASTDGGAQWKLLRTPASDDSDPHGNSFGPAYTGRSGTRDEEDQPKWIEQAVDLSPFAGQEVLLRFETITDDALNQNGFVVDDLSIPEIGYQEDFEQGASGWQGEGFVRVDNLLPQRFIVQAVTQGSGGTQVIPLPLDEANRATLTVPGFGTTVDSVTLLVSGATPVTSEKAAYTFSATLEP